MMDSFGWIDILGWLGSAGVIAAYGLNSYQLIRSDSLLFKLLNLIGGAFLILYTVHYDAFASAFINIVWVIIALIALLKPVIMKK